MDVLLITLHVSYLQLNSNWLQFAGIIFNIEKTELQCLLRGYVQLI